MCKFIQVTFLFFFSYTQFAWAEEEIAIEDVTYTLSANPIASGSTGEVRIASAKGATFVVKFFVEPKKDLLNSISILPFGSPPPKLLGKTPLERYELESQFSLSALHVKNPDGLIVEKIAARRLNREEESRYKAVGVVVYPYLGVSLQTFVESSPLFEMNSEAGTAPQILDQLPRIERLLLILRGVLKLLELQSANNFIHFDVNPANLLLHKQNVYLVDISGGWIVAGQIPEYVVASAGFIAPEVLDHKALAQQPKGAVAFSYATLANASILSEAYSYGRTILKLVCSNCDHFEQAQYILDRLIVQAGFLNSKKGNEAIASLVLISNFLQACLFPDAYSRLEMFRTRPLTDFINFTQAKDHSTNFKLEIRKDFDVQLSRYIASANQLFDQAQTRLHYELSLGKCSSSFR